MNYNNKEGGEEFNYSWFGEERVLSIQSWVCHGYVGNKCAVFALQHLGIEVDPINSVQLSNNTAYSSWKGESLPAEKMWDLYEGLENNNLTNYTHMLTGYNNNAQTLRMVLKVFQTLKKKNPNLIYVCDPVLGDNNELYVPKDLVEIYKNEVIPHADYLLPNQTEVEFLTGIKINNEEDAIKAIDVLHDMGIKNVIITSLFIAEKDTIQLIGSSKNNNNNSKNRFKIKVPKFHGYYTGTGDLLSSLILGWSIKMKNQQDNLASVCERAVSTLYRVIKLTHESKEKINNPKGIEYYELRLVQSRKLISDENLEILFKSTPI
eukprot:gene6592-8159_t